MRKATILAAEASFYFVICNGVSIYVINALNDPEECLTSVGSVIEDAKVATRVVKWKFLHVRRQANEGAYWMA